MKRSQLARLKSVIETDRLSVTAECVEMIVRDLSFVLSDYFGLSEKPKLTVSAKNGEYFISVSAKADAIKAFSVVRN